MDYTQILQTLQNNIPAQIWYLIPFFLVAVVIKSAWFKGKAGEAVVNLSARLFLDKTRYHLIKNVTLPSPRCQGEMVKRTVKRGENIGKEFFGCKAFPKCWGMAGASLLQ